MFQNIIHIAKKAAAVYVESATETNNIFGISANRHILLIVCVLIWITKKLQGSHVKIAVFDKYLA